MELDVKLGKDSLSIPVENPFQLDLGAILRKIEVFSLSKGANLAGLDIKGLLPGMVRGIAGCEAGCPADAKNFASKGFGNFKLAYIEGGIITANTVLENGDYFSLKLFPDF